MKIQDFSLMKYVLLTLVLSAIGCVMPQGQGGYYQPNPNAWRAMQNSVNQSQQNWWNTYGNMQSPIQAPNNAGQFQNDYRYKPPTEIRIVP